MKKLLLASLFVMSGCTSTITLSTQTNSTPVSTPTASVEAIESTPEMYVQPVKEASIYSQGMGARAGKPMARNTNVNRAMGKFMPRKASEWRGL